MADAESKPYTRTYAAEHVIAATPWDIFEMLADPAQQGQWRDRWEKHGEVVEDRAYTYVRFEDGLELTLEPEGAGTLIRASKSRTAETFTAKLGLLFTSRKRVEYDLQAQLKRIGATAEFGAI
ncbi:hypothetical protein [Patulibacter minatonensis]|uniref:hypothetical protein n=1 Tax=Patulibacter minatonensis TaxID=298163 RepID=UPI000479B2C2|nr:hypothetical protein [Patulibacter minatonensis]